MRPALTRLRVVPGPVPDHARRGMACDFPHVRVEAAERPEADDAVVEAAAWRFGESFAPFDEAVERATSCAIAVVHSSHLEAAEVASSAREIFTRYQRFVERRNRASATPLFARIREDHARAHDTAKPLVKADLDHAVDTWQWMLRLEPRAGLAAQLAALFHDVERLETEADRRVEHVAPDYGSFKDAHARRGGDRAYEMLLAAGLDRATAARVRTMIAIHERRGDDPEVDLLNDADALSFFSLNSPGYADYFGAQQTRKKIAYTLGRMGARARARLAGVRLRADVQRLLGEVARP